jgi:NADH-quinone oxidoreductase subunit E
MAFALTPEREQQVDEVLTRYPERRAALLPILWLCQRQNGWISPEVVEYVAERLDLSTAIVKGVVTFYTMFFDEPVGENVIWVCRTLSCDLRGGKAIQEHLENRLGCKAGHTSSDGKFTLLKAECLAACGQAPMIQINDYYYENLDVAQLDRILDAHATQGGEAAALEFSTFATFAPPRPSSGVGVSSAPPPPSKEAVRLASQPPPSDTRGERS